MPHREESTATLSPHAEEAIIPGEYTKLILCFDGTGNTFSGTNADTNVVKILRKLDRNSDKQYHYYQTGIGTYDVNESSVNKTALGEIRSAISKTIDQGFGTTFDAHIMAGYRFLMRYYEPDAKIYIFGFSRGAYTAKYLARMVNKVGLLCKGNEEMVPFAYRLYQRSLKCESDDRMAAQKSYNNGHTPDESGSDDEATTETTPLTASATTNGVNGTNGINGTTDSKPSFINGDVKESDETKAAKKEVKAFSETFCRTSTAKAADHVNIKVFFLGMWDCVNSVAVAEANAPAPVEVSGTADHIRHAVAVDERRIKFKPALLAQDIRQVYDSNDKKAHLKDDILEVWFPGNHGDIGGGWPAMESKSPDEMSRWSKFKYIFNTMKQSNLKKPLDDDALQMSDMALDWMIREVELVGLKDPKSQVHWCHTKDSFKTLMNNKTKVQEHVIKGFMHDTLSFGYGSSFFKVLMWKFMECLPFIPRWELNEAKGWEPYRGWPNFNAYRDIPKKSLLHNSLKVRLEEVAKYRPKNNHGGSAAPCLLSSDKTTRADMVRWFKTEDVKVVDKDEERAQRHQTWQLSEDVKVKQP
ncbi:short chain dehydrogenase reductase family [Fusarium longipes]|uniref:Short chain dehydrogenase reductase family n=1 Tax=Fusarium longipes TaxID=694270 RepID=A0A395SYM6_9HYPO|nr:short chain dehydrogenase reductase family [Fusarium longipes]